MRMRRRFVWRRTHWVITSIILFFLCFGFYLARAILR